MGKVSESRIEKLINNLSYGQSYNEKVVEKISEIQLCDSYPIDFNKLKQISDIIEIEEKRDGSKKGSVHYTGSKYIICVSDIYGEMARRFTIAHELAHIIFDFEELENRKVYESNFASGPYTNDMVEIRANNFAVDLLIPSDEVYNLLVEEKDKKVKNGDKYYLSEFKKACMNRFEVSEIVVENKLKNIGIIKNG